MSSDLIRPGPPGGARDRNRKEKSELIQRVGLELFLENGVLAVTIDQIVSRAGIAKGSFYRYADGKRGLVEQLMAPLMEGMPAAYARCRAGLEEADRATLPVVYMRLAADLTDVVRENPRHTLLYLQECRTPATDDREPIAAVAAEIRSGAIELTALARERGLLQPGPAWLSATVVIGAAEELLMAYLRGDHPADKPEDVQAALVSMVLRGLAF